MAKQKSLRRPRALKDIESRIVRENAAASAVADLAQDPVSVQGNPSTLVGRVVNDQGRAFNIVLVRQGDRYGRNDCLVHDADDPLIEFYDATYESDDRFVKGRGQFVSRYYLRTLTDREHGDSRRAGLNLCGHEPAWRVNGENVTDALAAVDAALRGVSPEVVAHESAERAMFGCTTAQIDASLVNQEPRDLAMYAMGLLSDAQELLRRAETTNAQASNSLRQQLNVAKYVINKAVPR